MPPAWHRMRIIPADAGSTAVQDLIHDAVGDHPRGCGEHRQWITSEEQSQGSSPRMRGAPDEKLGLDKYPRIIPADAGSTLFRSGFNFI